MLWLTQQCDTISYPLDCQNISWITPSDDQDMGSWGCVNIAGGSKVDKPTLKSDLAVTSKGEMCSLNHTAMLLLLRYCRAGILKVGSQTPRDFLRHFQGSYKVKTVFRMILRCYLPFPLCWHLQWWCKSNGGWDCWYLGTNQGGGPKWYQSSFYSALPCTL